jgi:hypothetical protein
MIRTLLISIVVAMMFWAGLTQACQKRSELNGFRVKFWGQAGVYLVDEGYRRLIPNPSTYNNLFRDWNGIIEMDIYTICERTGVSNGAVLAKAYDDPAVYFVDGGLKRPIPNESVFDKYHFDWSKIYSVPKILLDSIWTGTTIW